MLETIIPGVIHKPPRVVFYGVHGIGKSTFAASAPAPIFIPTEEGANEIDVPKFPTCTTHGTVLEALRALYKESHEYETVVIDSVDWLEDFIQIELKANYTDKELGYGKDSVKAAERMSEILTALNHVREKRGMTCILIAHSEVRRFDSPLTEPYDRYQPTLQPRFSSLLQEWADAVLFSTFDISVKKEDVGFNKEVRRGISVGERMIYTEERPAFLAKNRYGMPIEIKMTRERGYAAISQYIPYYAISEAASQQSQQPEGEHHPEGSATK